MQNPQGHIAKGSSSTRTAPVVLEYSSLRTRGSGSTGLITTGLLVCAWTSYILALLSPAMDAFTIGGGWVTGPGYPPSLGWHCLLFGIWWWPANLLFFLSPLAGWRVVVTESRVTRAIAALLYTLSTVSVWVVPAMDTSHLRIGSWLWVAAHSILLVAIYVPMLTAAIRAMGPRR